MGKRRTQERRNRILELLEDSKEPLSGSYLAERFQVSRQVIVTDIAKAKKALDEANAFVSVTEVVGVALEDKPGALAKVVKILADQNINIEYMYAFITVSKQFAYVVLRVENNEETEKILSENGIRLVTEKDMEEL